MTTRREIPIVSDSLGWVHSELAEIKSRVALAQQAAEQSRALAADASDKAQQVRTDLDQFAGLDNALAHLQSDASTSREQIVRTQDDIRLLNQSREEMERFVLAEAERVRQDRNEIGRRFGEQERLLDSWVERFSGVEEMNRRNLELVSQLAQRIETLEANQLDAESLRSRTTTAISRIDGEIQRLTGFLDNLEREDTGHHERINTAFETLRRLENDIEAMRTETNRINRIDDRLELVQAERTRHNERLNELTQEMEQVESFITDQAERTSLIEARMTGYQEELRQLKERLRSDRETLTNYLQGLNDLAADIRKREIGGLEKEIRDIRGRAINFLDE